MVVNIAKATATVSHPLDYNDRKVANDVATLIAGFNVDGMTPREINATFQRYEHMNIRTKRPAFHMSINPTEQDNMSQENIVKFARKLMDGLGYGKQPYLIYRHNDIDRVHYHVVSIRTDAKGRKIRDYNDRPLSYKLMKEFQKEFGYTIGKGSGENNGVNISKFDTTAGNIKGQLTAIYNECLQYNFTSVEQFRLILRKAHISLSVRTGRKDMFIIRGLDAKMKPCTKEYSERSIGLHLYDMYQKRALECLNLMTVMQRERTRISNCARGPLKDATSELHFRNMMRKNGIDVSFDRHQRSGEIIGGNFIDHVTKCAFKLSEFGPSLSLEKVQEADHNWPHNRPTPQSRSTNLAGEMLLGLVSGDGSKSKGQDKQDETDMEREERLLQQSL